MRRSRTILENQSHSRIKTLSINSAIPARSRPSSFIALSRSSLDGDHCLIARMRSWKWDRLSSALSRSASSSCVGFRMRSFTPSLTLSIRENILMALKIGTATTSKNRSALLSLSRSRLESPHTSGSFSMSTNVPSLSRSGPSPLKRRMYWIHRRWSLVTWSPSPENFNSVLISI